MSKELRRISHAKFLEELTTKYTTDKNKWAFKCPSCGNVQTIQDFIDIKENPTNVNFSCIGRYTEGRGCNWTLGGLLKIHSLEIEMDDSRKTISPSFEIA